MTIKEYIRKNYAYLLRDKPAFIVVNGDTFVVDSLSRCVEKKEYADLLDHEFMCLSRCFDSRNNESYLVIGRTDII